jgi:alkylmercury lyase-like protein
VLPIVCASHPEHLMSDNPLRQSTRRDLPVGSVQERQAGLPEPLRAFHRRLLAGFLTHSGPPEHAAVADMAVELGLDPDQALVVLAAADLVHRDPAGGTIGVAYPFSVRRTLHRVEPAGGPTVFAMCALDALGIPQMTRRDARVSATDPVGGQPVTVQAYHGAWRWEPATTVVLVATAAGGVCGSVADCCCPHINFHTDPLHAQTYLQAHPGMTGELLGQADAVETAGRIFGGLLDSQQRQTIDDELAR